MLKKAVRVPGVPLCREDGSRVPIPPGPCLIDDDGPVVRLLWQQHGEQRVELLFSEDYLRAVAQGALRPARER